MADENYEARIKGLKGPIGVIYHPDYDSDDNLDNLETKLDEEDDSK